MKLDFLSAGAAQALVQAVARAADVEVAGSFGAVGAMLEKFDAAAACDIVILTRKQIDTLAMQGRVVDGTPADLGRVPTSVAVRVGEPIPDVSSEAALRATLLAADAIYIPDPTRATAGIHFVKVIEALGIGFQLEPRLRKFPNGSTAMREMAGASGHPVGCTQASEILATPGVQFVAPLPQGFELETVYAAAVNTHAANAVAARDFVARLTGEAASGQRRAAGFG